MKIGIIGLPQVGKKTLFGLLTGEPPASAHGTVQDIKIGSARIRDSRFDRLVGMYRPRRSVPASIDVVLAAKFDKETVASGEFLKSLAKCDALCHIVRAFSDGSVFHVDGSIDPLRDIENVYAELMLADLILIEKRIERIAADQKKGAASPAQTKEKDILDQMKKSLDGNIPLIHLQMNDEDRKLMSTYQFLTRKPVIIVLNVDDDKITDTALAGRIEEKYGKHGVKVMQISAKIELELSSLTPEEQETFLKDLNIKEPALNRLSALCFDVLGLISFFTVGEDEVRAWTARKGSPAPEAAGVIHTDLQRGFIRAEIIKSDELFALGSEAKLKEAGRLMLKGKDYVVEDGDIMHVRFNV